MASVMRRLLGVQGLAKHAAVELDERFQSASLVRRTINKVFPDHWSFMLGEIALYSFIMLLLTGTFLGLFFDPSTADTVYNGSYTPLHGLTMSKAYSTTLGLSFDVRGGLIMRQMHHWAANLFMAAILLHMLRIFFTGVFRKPRETNWVIGLTLFWLGFFEGFMGYSLPDDALSGTGLRIAYSIALSIPVIGSWAAVSLFGGAFPGTEISQRLYISHVFIVPALIAALIVVHLALIVKQKHTQWHRPGHTRRNVVGTRMIPGFALSSTGLALSVFGMIALMGGVVQINPIWLYGPYEAYVVSAGSQPDWYVWLLDGALRLFPPWAIYFGHTYMVPAAFWPGVVFPGVLATLAFAYPVLERRFTGDYSRHELAQRPRDAPHRTALGAMALALFAVVSLSAANDIFAAVFDVSLNAIVWAGRILALTAPPIAYFVTLRIALGLQQHDRTVLEEGMETGLLVRAADGRYYELHQPLGPIDEKGHIDLEYADWVVPKRANRIGLTRAAVRGFFVPVEHPPELERLPEQAEQRVGAKPGEPAAPEPPSSPD